jgi:hypothetical protein
MFSCRTRGFCPSCHARRLEEWGDGKKIIFVGISLDSDEALWKKAMKVKGARGIQLFANGWKSQFVRDYKTPKRDAGSDEVEKHRGQEAGRIRGGDKCNEILRQYGICIMIKMKMT